MLCICAGIGLHGKVGHFLSLRTHAIVMNIFTKLRKCHHSWCNLYFFDGGRMNLLMNVANNFCWHLSYLHEHQPQNQEHQISFDVDHAFKNLYVYNAIIWMACKNVTKEFLRDVLKTTKNKTIGHNSGCNDLVYNSSLSLSIIKRIKPHIELY